MLKQAIIFGASKSGESALKVLNRKFDIKFFVDNDTSKQDGFMDQNIPIISPDNIKLYSDYVIIVAVTIPYAPVKQLEQMNISNQIFLFKSNHKDESNYLLYEIHDFDITRPDIMDHFCSTNPDSPYNKHYSMLDGFERMRFDFALDRIKSSFSNDIKILELGCGPGQFANMLFDNGYTNYIGVDFSPVCIDIAKKSNPSYESCFIEANILKMDFSSFDYDIIVSFEVLEHVKNDIEILDKIETGKTIFLSLPNFLDFNHFRKYDDLEDIVRSYNNYINIINYSQLSSNKKNIHHAIECIKK